MTAYLDHAATTPLRSEAFTAMLPWLTGRFGNPSGAHATAREASRAVEAARDDLADVVGFPPAGVIWTSGGTEADNLAVRARRRDRRGAWPPVVVTTTVEHEALLAAAHAGGVEVRLAPVGPTGLVDLDGLAGLLDDTVGVVSVMSVNNETGVVEPLDEVAALVRRLAPRAVLHSDAVCALSWFDLRTTAAAVDLISLSAHKFGGPQGVGALVVRDTVEVLAVQLGGPQERERRAGTHNVAGIVGAAAAAVAADARRPRRVAETTRRRDRLVAGILATVPGAVDTVAGAPRAAGHAHVCVPGVASEELLALLDDAGIAASAGSACASGALEPSHVLVAMGVDADLAAGSLRLTLGETTTDADVAAAISAVADAAARLRAA